MPSSLWMGCPAILPLMSHRQMSIAPMALVDTDRFIFHMSHQIAPMSWGLRPMTSGLRNSISPSE